MKSVVINVNNYQNKFVIHLKNGKFGNKNMIIIFHMKSYKTKFQILKSLIN